MNTATASKTARLTELDGLRIAAFGLLIAYHTGMFFVPWDFHVKAPQPVPALEEWMLLLTPWRMSLLFVVSGAATALMVGSGRALAGPRSRRLLLPLLFGMAVVVPPQPYMEVVGKLHYAGSYADFLQLYFTAYHGFCEVDKQGIRHCLTLPTWNHLWFVAYLWAYTLLLAGALKLFGKGWADAARWAEITRGARLLWLPWLVLALLRQQLVALFPTTHDLVHDFYNHALYGVMFLLGFVFFGRPDDALGAWAAAVRLRWWALGSAVLAQGCFRAYVSQFSDNEDWPEATLMLLRTVSAWRQWAPIVAALGFARLHLAGRDSPALRWLGQGVFCFYIVHQTVIVLAAPPLSRLGWPWGVQAAALVALTAAVCVLVYEIVRRIPLLAACFGVERTRQASGQAPGQPPPAAAAARSAGQ